VVTSSNLIVEGRSKNGAHPCLRLLYVAHLGDPIRLWYTVVRLNPESMRADPKLSQRDPERVHTMHARIRGADNDAILQLQKVL